MEVKDPQFELEKGKKNKYLKVGIIGFTAVVLIAAVLIMGQAEFFSGWFKVKQTVITGKGTIVNQKGLYKNNDQPPKPVSPVVSAVPTVIASPVPSQVGPSIVVSQVPSAITSPVASGVPLSQVAAAKINMQMLPALTSQVLKQAAQDDLKKNPKKYELTKEQKKSMIDLYMQKLKK